MMGVFFFRDEGRLRPGQLIAARFNRSDDNRQFLFQRITPYQRFAAIVKSNANIIGTDKGDRSRSMQRVFNTAAHH